jgi:ketosteroid isomerase-like protein
MSKDLESLLVDLNPEDRQEIATIPQRFVKQALEGDWDGVARLYHPAAIRMPPDQPAVEGREAIRQALSRSFGAEGGVRLEDVSVSIREAEGNGELVFVRAAYHAKLSVQIGDQKVSPEQRGPYVNLPRRDEEGRWRIYRQIYGRHHPAPLSGTARQSLR